jgi:DNA repair protein RadD
MELRPYQADLLNKIADARSLHDRVLAVAATGAGKTVVQGQLISEHVATMRDSLYLVHRRNLVIQTVASLQRIFGVTSATIMAGHDYRPGLWHSAVASRDTIVRRLDTLGEQGFTPSLILLDEAHHVSSGSYQKILAAFPSAQVVGFTATPCTSTGGGLGNDFSVIVCPESCQSAALVDGGYLSRPVYFVPTAKDIGRIKHKRAGEYLQAEQEGVFNTPRLVGQIVEQYLKLGQGRRTILFSVSVSHAFALVREFAAAGVGAVALSADNSDEDRKAAWARMASGEVSVICNYGLFLEGSDVPDVGCVVLARKFGNIVGYRQAVGRGLRPSDLYDDCIVIDHAGNYGEHGSVTEPTNWSLEPGKVVEKAEREKEEKEITEHTCDVCARVYTGKACPLCGTPAPARKHKDIETVEAELVQAGELPGKEKKVKIKDDPYSVRLRVYQGLLYLARDSKSRDGWAAMKYVELYRKTPREDGLPIIVEPAEAHGSPARRIQYLRIRAYYARRKGR